MNLARCNPLSGRARRLGLVLAVAALAANLLVSVRSIACPFCVALSPTLVQQREAADVVALAELTYRDEDQCRFRLHRVTNGAERFASQMTLTIADESVSGLGDALPPSLFVLLGTLAPAEDPRDWDWTVYPVDELGAAYFFEAPSLRTPAAERLRYFARFLEHRQEWIAADATMEFAHAPYEDVAAVADALPMKRIRAWLVDPGVLPERKGFYGLVLGLAPREEDRVENRRLLQEIIETPADDFRSGFDGMLSGYLLLTGTDGLELLERRYLANPDAADGDVRHAMSALRFYHEYGRDIPQQRLCEALRHLLRRPEFAASAIVDLARWQDWKIVDEVADLFDAEDYPQPATRRAVVGYLITAPTPTAASRLAELRRGHPDEIADVERRLSRSATPQ